MITVAIFRNGNFHSDAAYFLKARFRSVRVAGLEVYQKVELNIGTFP
jgi:hypothetical protein